jgi:hypothetical protein
MPKILWISVAAILAILIIALTGYWFVGRQRVAPSLAESLTAEEEGQDSMNDAARDNLSESSETGGPEEFTAAAARPKIITCNPRSYAPEYFDEEKPCVSDMTPIDIERESRALAILKRAGAEDPVLESRYNSLPQLYVSAERYQLVMVNLAPLSGFIVVDIEEGAVTDEFSPGKSSWFHEGNILSIVESGGLTDPEREAVSQYALGSAKSKILSNTTIYAPETYFSYRYTSAAGTFSGVQVMASTTDSVTLAVFDSNSSIPDPESQYYEDFIKYAQVGAKRVHLEN